MRHLSLTGTPHHFYYIIARVLPRGTTQNVMFKWQQHKTIDNWNVEMSLKRSRDVWVRPSCTEAVMSWHNPCFLRTLFTFPTWRFCHMSTCTSYYYITHRKVQLFFRETVAVSYFFLSSYYFLIHSSPSTESLEFALSSLEVRIRYSWFWKEYRNRICILMYYLFENQGLSFNS